MLKKMLIIFLILILAIQTISVGLPGELNDYQPTLNSSDYEDNGAIRIGGIALNVIRTIGIIVTVIGITILGVKIMVGSIEEKAEYKQKLIPLIIGSILIVGSTFIVSGINTALRDKSSGGHTIERPPIGDDLYETDW